MDSNKQVGTSSIAGKDGKLQEGPNLQVAVESIYNFVERNREAYFEDHSLDWCLDEIIARGKAEIKRSIDAAVKRAKEKAALALLEMHHLTPDEAAKYLAMLEAQRAQKAQQAQSSTATK